MAAGKDGSLAVQAPAELREQILSTLQVIDTDLRGRPVTPPLAGNQTWRPDGPAVTELTGVRSVAACSYDSAHLTRSLTL